MDNLQEGIAQVANYEEYFHFDRKKEFAKSKYNIEVLNPDLILIVRKLRKLKS